MEDTTNLFVLEVRKLILKFKKHINNDIEKYKEGIKISEEALDEIEDIKTKQAIKQVIEIMKEMMPRG